MLTVKTALESAFNKVEAHTKSFIVYKEMVYHNQGLNLAALMPAYIDMHLNPPEPKKAGEDEEEEGEEMDGEEGEKKEEEEKEPPVTIDTFRELLDLFAEQKARIEAVAEHSNVDIVRIMCEDLKSSMLPSPTSCLDTMRELLPDLSKQLLQKFLGEVRELDEKLISPCSMADEFVIKLNNLELAQKQDASNERR